MMVRSEINEILYQCVWKLLNKALYVFLLVFGIFSSGVAQQSTSAVQFGKNRVQYNNDSEDWTQYESNNFITYWYGKSRNVGIAASQIAELNHSEIRKKLEHRMNEKIEIIVYSDISDLHQTNIGSSEVFETKPGETTVVDNKLFVYFDGRHDHLQKQIRNGISRVYLLQMLLGNNWQQLFNYLSQTEYPEWYLKGMVEFASEGWNLEADDKMKTIILSNKYKDFYSMASELPTLAGQSFWYYTIQKYGLSVVANILYSNRINRSIENAFNYIVGRNFESIIEEAWNNYHLIYANEQMKFAGIDSFIFEKFKNKYASEVIDVDFRPHSEEFTFVENERGKWSVRLYNPNTKKLKKLYQKGQVNPFQETDYNYPITQWDKEGKFLYIIYERKDEVKLVILDEKGKDVYHEPIPERYERIYDFDIVSKDTLIMSANIKGFSDLVMFDIATRQTEVLSTDSYDDIHVTHGSWLGKEGVFFSSNRNGEELVSSPRDTLVPIGTYDIYFLPKSQWGKLNIEAQRITNTKESSELELQYTDNSLYYQMESKGKLSLLKLVVKGKDEIISNFNHNVQHYSVNPKSRKVAYVMYGDTKDMLYFIDEEFSKASTLSMSTLFKPINELMTNKEGKTYSDPQITSPPPHFQSKFPDPPAAKQPFQPQDKEVKREDTIKTLQFLDLENTSLSHGNVLGHEFERNRVIASRLKFKTTGINIDFSNKLLYDGLDTYAGEKRGYEYPPFGLLFESRNYDIFEDYELEGGARFPLLFNGSEYYFLFKDKKHQWDKIYGFYRKAQRYIESKNNLTEPTQTREISTIGTFELRYPFDMFRSIRLRATLRFDRLNPLITDNETLKEIPSSKQRIGIRAEYVYDDTYDLMKNMKVGSRYKVYVEGVNRFQIQLSPFELSASDAFMTIIGMDARHYIRLGKYMILAGRIAGATSFGSEQILYFMGGVDNWLRFGGNGTYSEGIGIPEGGNFAYNGYASQVRGFKQNVRNGASYVLANLEFRISPFNYLSKRSLKSTFLKNFMIVGFLDTGTAWYGVSPYSKKNPLNVTQIQEPIDATNPEDIFIIGTINYFRDPLVLGYGAGLRADLYGFYIRLDKAWGIDTKEVNDGIFYFSLGMDF